MTAQVMRMDHWSLVIGILSSIVASVVGALIGFVGSVIVMWLRDERQDRREAREAKAELMSAVKDSAELAREPPKTLSYSFDPTIGVLLLELLVANRDICAIASSGHTNALTAFREGSQELEPIVTKAKQDLEEKLARFRLAIENLEKQFRHHLVD